MTQRICLLVAGAVFLAASCSHARGSDSIAAALPSPSAVQITRPASSLPPQLAAFSGTWEGRWVGAGGASSGTLPSRLVVEKINAKSAQVVYIYGTQRGYFRAGWFRAHA